MGPHAREGGEKKILLTRRVEPIRAGAVSRYKSKVGWLKVDC